MFFMFIFRALYFFLGNFFPYSLHNEFINPLGLFYLIILLLIILMMLIRVFNKLNKLNKHIKSIFYSILIFVLGMLFGMNNIQYNLNYKLPNNIYSKKVNLKGKVNSFINKNSNNVEFVIDYIEFNNKKYKFNFEKKVLVKFGFTKNKKRINKVKYGDYLSLQVTLKKITNKNLQNYYFNKNTIATGYFIDILKNNELSQDNKNSSFADFKKIIYNKIFEYTNNLNNKYLIHGLILGDKSNISKDEKLLFQNTGVSHLLAISGMHLGAVFLLGNYLFSFLWKIFYKFLYFNFDLSKKKVASLGGLIFIIFYGVISGFSIPTIRAFIFLLINSISVFFPISLKRTDVIGLTLFSVVIIEPFCYLDLGFWLSFIIVTMVLYLNNIEINIENKFFKAFSLPIKLFIFSTPITLLFFQKAPLVSPLVNILAIPYINLIVLPLLILSLIFILNQALSKFFLNISNMLLDNFISFLKFCDWQYFVVLPIDIYFFGLLSIFCLLLFMPNKVPGKFIGSLAIALIFFNYFNNKENQSNSFLKKDNYYTIKSKENINYISYFYS